MKPMWMRRFVSATVVVAFALMGALLGVSGLGIYLCEIVAVPVAIAAGIALEPRIQMRRRGHVR